MSTTDSFWQPIRNPNFQPTYNTHNVSGLFNPTDANIAFTQQEFTIFSTYVPFKQVDPLLTTRCILCGPLANIRQIASSEYNAQAGGEGGTTVPSNGQYPSMLFVITTNVVNAIGTLAHEWGHSVDNQYQFAPLAGASGTWGVSSSTLVNTMYARSSTFWAGAPSGQNTLYGWTNQREYIAELFRFHYIGSHGANSSVNTFSDGVHGTVNSDQMFRELISGISTAVYNGPDDSFVTAAHTFIAGLAPPYPPAVFPSN